MASWRLQIWSRFTYRKVDCIPVTYVTDNVGAGTNSGSSSSNGPQLAEGFSILSWGYLYAFALPLGTYLIGKYFTVLDNALFSLDEVIKPEKHQDKLFGIFVADQLRTQWSSWIFPVSISLAVVLAIVADGRDIIAPLQSSVILPTCTRDWSNVGYTHWSTLTGNTESFGSSLWYLVFNICAFSMEAFLGYCGILLLLLTGAVFSVVFSYGIGNRSIIDTFIPPGATPTPARYSPHWKWCFERCGLDKLDVVFAFFTGLSLFALVASALSMLVNLYLRKHVTPGSVILAVSTMLFIPWSAFWIFVPYLTNFPRHLPSGFEPTRTPCEEPSPWPFGSEKLSWILIGISTSLWLFLATSLVRVLFNIAK